MTAVQGHVSNLGDLDRLFSQIQGKKRRLRYLKFGLDKRFDPLLPCQEQALQVSLLFQVNVKIKEGAALASATTQSASSASETVAGLHWNS